MLLSAILSKTFFNAYKKYHYGAIARLRFFFMRSENVFCAISQPFFLFRHTIPRTTIPKSLSDRLARRLFRLKNTIFGQSDLNVSVRTADTRTKLLDDATLCDRSAVISAKFIRNALNFLKFAAEIAKS